MIATLDLDYSTEDIAEAFKKYRGVIVKTSPE